MSITKPCPNCTNSNAAHLLICKDMDRMTEQRDALAAQVEQLREAFERIQRYGLDTLSGRSDGPDDRNWQRSGVNEMTKRARIALALPGLSTAILKQRDAKVLREAADRLDDSTSSNHIYRMADKMEAGK